MPSAPRRLRNVVDATLCADWLALIDRRYASPELQAGTAPGFSVHSSSLRLSQLDGIDLESMWQALAASGVLRLCQQALQSPLACNIDQSWVRRQYAPDCYPAQHAPHGWHQDGALHFDFITHERDHPGKPYPADALLPMATCWTALTPCGVDAPGLELVTQRLDALIPATDLTDRHLHERFGPEAFWRPALQAGDALLFGGDTLHRTHVAPTMTQTRTSIEWRFFAADNPPARLRGERFTALAAQLSTLR